MGANKGMKVSDIVVSISNILKDNFNIETYTKETTEGYDRPCFFIDLISNNLSHYNKNYNENTFQVLITYLDTKREDEKLYSIIETMKSLFMRRLPIKDRQLKITSFDYDFIGDNDTMLEFTIDIHYMESVDNNIDGDIMENIDLEFKGE